MIAPFLVALLLQGTLAKQEDVIKTKVEQPVTVLRDKWGVPHIYASTQYDLFFGQGYMAARDRLFQIDLWRRTGTGKLAEVLGPSAIERDRIAIALRYRGDWEREWASYGKGAHDIAAAFTDGINAYIRQLQGKRPPEFARAGYDPGLWVPEDCVARMAGFVMTRNASREIQRALDIQRFGLDKVRELLPVSPAIPIEVPEGLDLKDITPELQRKLEALTGTVRFPEGGSNNWVVDGTLTASGKPLLANDPHRPILIPSLRKTVHLVGPGWNAIGAGEPALPGIALGHNERIAFGFTIVGIDQQDLYVERLNPKNPNEYSYRGEWREMEVERHPLKVKGKSEPAVVEIRYTVHGPVLYQDPARHRAYALRWTGAEPGAAGYLAALAVARAQNWPEFLEAMKRYKIPSENMVYADAEGNIGWQASGLTPVREGWSGLLPVPGHTGKYEWNGFHNLDELPRLFNPPGHTIATANHNILPPGFKTPLGYEWALPFRYERVREMLEGGRKFTVADFERMQQDVVSLPARRFQAVLRKWKQLPEAAKELLEWDASLKADSRPALIYEVWMAKLPAALFGPELGARVDLERVLARIETGNSGDALARSLRNALAEIEKRLGPNRAEWRWGRLHYAEFQHALNERPWHRGPVERPGDGNTVNATGWSAARSDGSVRSFRQTSGASYRQILDLSNWDNSVMTNVPGESGDPQSPHYDDLLREWASRQYHPMLFSRDKVEAATVERIRLVPQ
ncbi:MAG: penicillin acylase family protein [Bryobacteraceae bacterium]